MVASELLLADGTGVELRLLQPDDDPALADFQGRLPEESHALASGGDAPDRMALVATTGQAIVGVARYDRLPGGDQAELALVVEDRFQGRGLGTALLQRLAAFAHDRGVARLVAVTSPEHQRVRQVVRRAGFETASVYDGRTVKVAFSTAPVPAWNQLR